MKNRVLFLCIVLCGSVYGMEQTASKSMRELSDETLITLYHQVNDSEKQEKEGDGATTEVPYGIVKKYSLLKNALSSHDAAYSAYEIPVSGAHVTKEQLTNVFALHASVLSHESQQERRDALDKLCNEKRLVAVLHATNYLGGKTLYRVATAVAASKLEVLALNGKKFDKAASFLKQLTNTDYEHDIFLHLCNTAQYGHEIYATPQNTVLLEGHAESIRSICFSPDGKQLASGGCGRIVRLWDVGIGKCKATLEGHEDSVHAVCFSPDGKRLASGGYGSMVRLWDVGTGQCTTVLMGSKVRNYSVCFSPNGTKLASCGYDGIVRVWDIDTKQCVEISKGYNYNSSSICFSLDGKRLASGGDDKMVRLWDVGTGQCKAILEGHVESIHSICFLPDGKRLASCGFESVVRLWDVGIGQCTTVLMGSKFCNYSVCLLPDGTKLAASGYDTIVRVWDIATKQCVEISKEHKSVYSVCFSPDGTKLAFEGKNHTINLATLHVLKENFNLASLLLLEFLLHNRNNSELNRAAIENYQEIFTLLPKAFQEKFAIEGVCHEK